MGVSWYGLPFEVNSSSWRTFSPLTGLNDLKIWTRSLRPLFCRVPAAHENHLACNLLFLTSVKMKTRRIRAITETKPACVKVAMSFPIDELTLRFADTAADHSADTSLRFRLSGGGGGGGAWSPLPRKSTPSFSKVQLVLLTSNAPVGDGGDQIRR